MKNGKVETTQKNNLDLRDFFEAFEKDNPYMMSAISQLNEELSKTAPQLMSTDAIWFKTWSWGGKKKLY